MTNFTFIDLFAGIGGFRIATESVGGKCIGFSEIDKNAIETYCANFNEDKKHNFGDIRKIESLPYCDFLTAGVPCQSWSIAGRNLGFNDDRGKLWNDAIYLLEQTQPKAFLFENVKGLADPRNKEALEYIMTCIENAGYHANYYTLDANEYSSIQHRVRIYIIGFKDKKFADQFQLPKKDMRPMSLGQTIGSQTESVINNKSQRDSRWSLSCNEYGLNDYFLFNDIRGGHSTIHSWDIQTTTDRQKHICQLLLKNRRKSKYGKLDGNPLSLQHFQELDNTITQEDIDSLVELQILKPEQYLYEVNTSKAASLSEEEALLISISKDGVINIDDAKSNQAIKLRRINVAKSLIDLSNKGIVNCKEVRYDFKNSKISTGLNGVSRIFMPTSVTYPTLVASDTNDYIATRTITAQNAEEYKHKFIEEIYKIGAYRKITRSEACRIQGFPENFLLPESRALWMKLIGNSVTIPVIKQLAEAITNTGVFEETNYRTSSIIRSTSRVAHSLGQ